MKTLSKEISKLFTSHEYLTVTFIVRATKISKKHVLACLENNSHIFKKSYMLSDNGADVYFLRKNCFWKLKDIWNTFCHINSLKY